MNELDLIFVEGETPCISNSIKFVETLAGNKTKWTHVGIVVTHKIFNFLTPNKTYVLESAIHQTTTDGNKLGVQISTFANFITRTKSYEIKKLKNNPYQMDEKENFFRIEQFNKIINDFYLDYKDKYYEFTLIEMFASVFKCCGLCYNCFLTTCCCFNKDTFMFCSELIVKLLQRLEYIPFSVSQLQSPHQLELLLIDKFL